MGRSRDRTTPIKQLPATTTATPASNTKPQLESAPNIGKPTLTIQRHQNIANNAPENTSIQNNRNKKMHASQSQHRGMTSRCCRECGGNHRTSKCNNSGNHPPPSGTSRDSHSRRNRSRSRSPTRNNNDTGFSSFGGGGRSSRKSDRDGGGGNRRQRSRHSRSTSPYQHYHSGSHRGHNSSHHHTNSYGKDGNGRDHHYHHHHHYNNHGSHNRHSDQQYQQPHASSFNQNYQNNNDSRHYNNKQRRSSGITSPSKDQNLNKQKKRQKRNCGGKQMRSGKNQNTKSDQSFHQEKKRSALKSPNQTQQWPSAQQKTRQKETKSVKQSSSAVKETIIASRELLEEAKALENKQKKSSPTNMSDKQLQESVQPTGGDDFDKKQHNEKKDIEKPLADMDENNNTFVEPTPSQHEEKQADEEDDSFEDAQSSSNYSSSSQSSFGGGVGQDTAADKNDQEKGRSGEKESKKLTVLKKNEIINNEDKMSSISSLFLSEDKDHNNSIGFSKSQKTCEEQLKKADDGNQKEFNQKKSNKVMADDEMDDIDKISSPGKPRAKPKSINSPTMLSQNIKQTNMLLQSLSKQSQQIGGISQSNSNNNNNNYNSGSSTPGMAPSHHQHQHHSSHHQSSSMHPPNSSKHHHNLQNSRSGTSYRDHQSGQRSYNHRHSSSYNTPMDHSRNSSNHSSNGNGGPLQQRNSSYHHNNHRHDNSHHHSHHHHHHSGSGSSSRFYDTNNNSTMNNSHHHHQNQHSQQRNNGSYSRNSSQYVPSQQHHNSQSSQQQLSSGYSHGNNMLGSGNFQNPIHNAHNSHNQHHQRNQTSMVSGGGGASNTNSGGNSGLAGLNLQGIGDLTNYEESVRRLENTPDALAQKQILRKCSLKGAKIDVRLFVGQVPRMWGDDNIMSYFKKFGNVLEARIIRDKYDGSHRGCAFLKCQNFHEAENILDNHLPKLKNENGEFTDDPRRNQSRSNRSHSNSKSNGQNYKTNENNNTNTFSQNSGDEGEEKGAGGETRVASRLQVRYADGELERLGIVNLEGQEQSKLYCSHISKKLTQEEVTEMFQTFGDVEELYLFRDQNEQFRGSCFIKYVTRKQALKAVLYLNRKGMRDNKYAGALVDPSLDCNNSYSVIPEGYPVLDIRFADKKRKENFSLIYQTQQNQQLLQQWQYQQAHQQSSMPAIGSHMYGNGSDYHAYSGNTNPGAGRYNNNQNSGNYRGRNHQQNHHNHSSGGSGSASNAANSGGANNASQYRGVEHQQHLGSAGASGGGQASAMAQSQQQPQPQPQQQAYQGAGGYAVAGLVAYQQFGSMGLDQSAAMQQQLMLGPLQVFLRSLLIDPNKQHLYLEYFSQENGGKAYYLDTLTNVSQWEKPLEQQTDPVTGVTKTTVILNGVQVNEQMKQWLNSPDGQKVVQNFNHQHQMVVGYDYQAAAQQQVSHQQQQQQFVQHDARRGATDGHNVLADLRCTYPILPQQTQQAPFGVQHNGNSRAINLITQGLYKQGPTGANLFIFHLPNEWSDLDLFYFFDSFKLGTIVSVRIMTDKHSGRSKGYGFVSYDNPKSAEDAIRKVNGKQALGKRLKVELKKGGIATHLGGDVSLSKEDTQMIRRNMPDESYDENSQSSLLTSREGSNSLMNNQQWGGDQQNSQNNNKLSQQRSIENKAGDHHNHNNKRNHSFFFNNKKGDGGGGKSSNTTASQIAANAAQSTENVMQQILGKNAGIVTSNNSQLDSLASMTNMIYEGTTGVNEDLPPENISNLSGPQAAKNSDD